MPRKPRRRIVGRIERDLRQQREDDLRELQETLHREQYERRRADDEEYLDELDGFSEYIGEDHRERDDDPYDQ